MDKITDLEILQQLCKDEANKHGWKVYWSRFKAQAEKGDRYLSIGDAISLIHSEASEALEAFRDNNRLGFAEELADIIIRVLHLAGDIDIDIVDEINKKIIINTRRPKHHGRVNL